MWEVEIKREFTLRRAYLRRPEKMQEFNKSGLSTSGSSYCDILGRQETVPFSLTFLTNLSAQPFIRVSSVISMQEIATSTYELLLRLS